MTQRVTRAAYTRALNQNAAELRARDARVHVLAPGPTELSMLGVNLMDTSRRVQVVDHAAVCVRRALQA